MRQYGIREVFATLQGEGQQTGTAAVFLRFTGCNAWDGREEHRQRDFERRGASCALWCDTAFVGTDRFSADDVVALVLGAAAEHLGRPQWVVCTGGEPLLQLDHELVRALQVAGFKVAVETNGSQAPAWLHVLDWITVSPKWMDERWTLKTGDELKLIVPAFDPVEVMRQVDAAPYGGFKHFFVQPQDGKGDEGVNAALDTVRRDPTWRLSLQTHKLLGLR